MNLNVLSKLRRLWQLTVESLFFCVNLTSFAVYQVLQLIKVVLFGIIPLLAQIQSEGTDQISIFSSEHRPNIGRNVRMFCPGVPIRVSNIFFRVCISVHISFAEVIDCKKV